MEGMPRKLSTYEVSMLVSERAKQLDSGRYPPLLTKEEISNLPQPDACYIAMEEVKRKLDIPLTIQLSSEGDEWLPAGEALRR